LQGKRGAQFGKRELLTLESCDKKKREENAIKRQNGDPPVELKCPNIVPTLGISKDEGEKKKT